MKLFVVFAMFFFVIAGYSSIYGQSKVISEYIDMNPDVSEYGMNRKKYGHFFGGVHVIAGKPEAIGAEIIYGRSLRYEFGYRKKRKFSETFSGGYELYGRRDGFRMAQQEAKLVPDSLLNDKEKLVFLSTGLAFYQRINFGQRGNHMGRFIDLGAYGDWYFHTRHITHNEEAKVRTKMKRTGLQFPETFGYGLMCRLGSGNLVVKANYRLSDLFSSGSGMPELPRFSFGLEIGMHN